MAARERMNGFGGGKLDQGKCQLQLNDKPEARKQPLMVTPTSLAGDLSNTDREVVVVLWDNSWGNPFYWGAGEVLFLSFALGFSSCDHQVNSTHTFVNAGHRTTQLWWLPHGEAKVPDQV